MKALFIEKYETLDNLKIKDVSIPVPKGKEVLIKVCAASVNDWDLGLLIGKPFVTRLFSGLLRPGIKIPGVDVAGIVESIGSSVTSLKPGDEVYGDLSESGFGAFAEYVCAKENALTIKPAVMSFEDAAALPHAGLLAVQGLIDSGQIKDNQKILINGAGGGVGTIGICITKLYQGKVTGVDSTTKLDMLKKIGFENTIDYKRKDFTEDKNQYDLILDTKMNRPVFRYVRTLKKQGRYVSVGGAINRILSAVVLAPLIALFSRKYIKVLALKPNKKLAYVNELYEKKLLKPVIDGPYAFDELPQLMKYFEEGKHRGKIVIVF